MKDRKPEPFTGEEMECKNCGWKFRSRWSLKSMWTAVEIDGHLFYFCPACWGVPRYLWPKTVKEAYDREHKK